MEGSPLQEGPDLAAGWVEKSLQRDWCPLGAEDWKYGFLNADWLRIRCCQVGTFSSKYPDVFHPKSYELRGGVTSGVRTS